MPPKKQRSFVKFHPDYKRSFPYVDESRKGKHFAYCKMCRADINIGHGGQKDISLHEKTKKHQENQRQEKAVTSTPQISAVLSKSADLKTTNAEMLFTCFLLEHNIPFAAADHAGPLFKAMFPNSEEAAQFAAARTKQACLLKTISDHSQAKITKALKTRPFSVGTDGGNNKAVELTLYPIVVTFYCPMQEQIRHCLLSVPSLDKSCTGKNIAELLLEEFEKLGMDSTWASNCISLVTDNANVMVGTKTGVLGQLRMKNENLFSIGCPCHLINLAAEKAASALPVKIDELLIDIFYYLEKSKKRKHALKEFQEMSNVETQKILKHVCTRWLSLGNCLDRLIANWSPLLNFFQHEVAQSESSSAKSIRLESYKIPKKVTATAGKSESGSSKCMTSTSSGVQPVTEKKLTAPSSQLVQKQLTFSSKLVHSAGETNDSAGCKKDKSASVALTISKSQRKRSSSSRLEAEKGQAKKARMDKTNSEPREERVLKSLLDLTKLAYANFLRAVVPIFEKTNKVLQGESPLIHRLQRILVGLLRNIQGGFILPSELAKSSSDPLSLDYRSRKNQKENAELFIGNGTADIVHDLPSEARQNFFDSVRRYYCNACDYITAMHSRKLT